MRLKDLSNLPPIETYGQKSKTMINLAMNDQEPIRVCEPSIEKVIKLPLEGVGNIMDILDTKPNPAECILLPLFFPLINRNTFSFHMHTSPSSSLHASFLFFLFFNRANAMT